MPEHLTRVRCWFTLALLLPVPVSKPSLSQAPLTPVPRPDLTQSPIRWAEAAAANQERIVNYDKNFPLRYRVRRVDDKGESLRELMETRDGTVARALEHNHQPLTAEENTDERQRLTDILASPDAFLRRVRRDEGSRAYASELLHSMAHAMLWSYTPGQPQLPNAKGPAVVLDFKPDSAFHPPSLVTETLTGIAGRVWVDPSTRCVLRIEGRILHPINFGWGGVLARIREGGTVVLEQQPAGPHRWIYSHLVEHLTIREVVFHTVSEDVTLDVSDVHELPASIGFREGIQQLLSMPVPTR